jgi:hypothetical protein
MFDKNSANDMLLLPNSLGLLTGSSAGVSSNGGDMGLDIVE